MQQRKNTRSGESGVSEVIGAVLLISVVVTAAALIGVALLSQPPPTKIPALDAVISSTGKTIQIYHNGGDTLQKGDVQFLVDGVEAAFEKNGDPSWQSWSSGEGLTYVSPNPEMVKNVRIVYTGAGASTVISSADFGASGAPTASIYIYTSTGSGGTISPSGTVAVIYGDSQTFTITPDTGYRVTDVVVDSSSVGAVTSYTFTNVVSSHTISASFALNPVITASAGTGGTIDPSGAVSVEYDTSQTFTITANSGYSIADVVVDSVSQGAIGSYTFTNVQADHTISATFTGTSYTITPSEGANGIIIPNTTQTVNYGGSQTFTMIPNTGYHVADVLIDSVSNGSISSYTFTNVQSDHTISVTFAINTYTITASAGTGGTIDPTGAVSVNYGAQQIFYIYPDSGYNIADVLVDGGSVGALSSYTFNNVQANHTIAASFVGVPTYSSLTPTVGTTAGGTSVTITGTHFTGASSVSFGGTANATGAMTVNSDTSITVITPAHTAGTVDVVITTPGGTATGTNAYTYAAAPTFASISPTGGTTAGGTSTIITGSGFTGATAVTFGGTAATSFTVNGPTSITATTPAHAAGAVDVVITTPVGTATGTNAYTYATAPTFGSVSPSTGSSVGGYSVTISGTGFTGATSVSFGGTESSSFTVTGPTSITAVVPFHLAGTVDVVVTTPGGIATGTNAFTYYTIQSFTTVGTSTWTVPSGITTVEYLVVGGGGGGGRYGGGGGAGGFRTGTLSVTPGSIQIVTVGDGGAGASSAYVRGSSGSNSVFGSITAAGGGGGGSSSSSAVYSGAAGGSGGGGTRSAAGGAGNTPAVSPSQGNNGGTGNTNGSTYLGGGGGGAGAVGVTATTTVAGNGGAGTSSSLSGSTVTYAGGGGGGCSGSYTAGSGGSGGGGAGSAGGSGTDGSDGLGGGGGGSGRTNRAAGAGGSGIVIIKYY